MTRRFCTLLLLVAACVPAGASGGVERGKGSPGIVMVLPALPGAFSTRLQAGILAFGKDYPDANVSVVTPDSGGADAQGKAIQELIAKRAQAILVVPDDPASLVPALGPARAAGVVTLTIGSPGQQQATGDVEPFDETDLGRHLMDVMATWMGYSGLWQPLVSHRDSIDDTERVNGEVAEASAAYPGVKKASDPVEDESDEDVARYRVADLMKAYPEVKGITAGNAAAVRGAARAVTEAGLVGTAGVFGTCYPSAAGDSLRRGAAIAVCFWDPADAAYAAARAAYELARRGKLSSGMDLKRAGYTSVTVKPNASGVPVVRGSAWVTVTRDNLKDWVAPDGSYKL